MPTSDTSQTERIRRIRSQIQAISRWVKPTVREENGNTAESTFVSRKFGQMNYRRPDANGKEEEKPCCSVTY